MEKLFNAVVLPDEDLADLIEEVGYRVEWREYPVAHAVCPQEIAR